MTVTELLTPFNTAYHTIVIFDQIKDRFVFRGTKQALLESEYTDRKIVLWQVEASSPTVHITVM